MTSHACHCPGRAGRNAVHEPAQVGYSGWCTSRHAQHEVELHGCSGSLALARHLEDGVEVTHLKALILGLDATLHHALAKGTHRGHGVVENLVAKVAGTAVEGSHLGKWCGVGRLKALVGAHAHSTTSRRNQNHIGALLEDSLLTLLEAGTVLSGCAIVPANVQVHNGSTGVDGRFCLANDLLNGIGNIWVLLLGNLGTANCGGNYQFIHLVVDCFIVYWF